MRLAVFSDVHGNLAALEVVLAHASAQAPDAFVNLGDLVTSPLWPRETLDRLRDLETPTVRGNHDRWLAEPDAWHGPSAAFVRSVLTDADREYLGALPPGLELDDGRVLAVHGTPRDDTSYLLEEAVGGRLALESPSRLAARLEGVTASLVLCGHSHLQHAAWAPGGRLVVNPGSVGCPRYVEGADLSRAEAGSPHARYAVATRRGDAWAVEFFALAYDWQEVVARALEAGRPDWAAAFGR